MAAGRTDEPWNFYGMNGGRISGNADKVPEIMGMDGTAMRSPAVRTDKSRGNKRSEGIL